MKSLEQLTAGSKVRVLWQCKKNPNHQWVAPVYVRTRGDSCPICRGLTLHPENYLSVKNPELAKQWHPTKNGDLTPNHVTNHSIKRVWWICEKGHEWICGVGKRNRGAGCPYCTSHKMCKENCFAIHNKNLTKEWHPTKNGKITPFDVSKGTSIKFWWICEKGHEWQASCAARNGEGGSNCPFCSNKKVSKDNCLAITNPKLATEWNFSRNGGMSPYDFTRGSNKRVWWICEKGHEWQAKIANRNSGFNCPFCNHRTADKDNSLAAVNPNIAFQWNYRKNGKGTPGDFLPFSCKKVWWICDKGHEWKAKICDRNSGNNCPICSGKKVSKENCLHTLNRKLSNEWNYSRNSGITPMDVTSFSNKKVWWRCKSGHEWETTVYHRTSGTNCPYCAGRKVCKDNCLSSKNPELAKQWHPTKNLPLTPDDVTRSCAKKVWWVNTDGSCVKMSVNSRTRHLK